MNNRLFSTTGFLIRDLGIALGVVVLAAGLVIPRYLVSQHDANEAAAVKGLRTLIVALEHYHTYEPPFVYPQELGALPEKGRYRVPRSLARGHQAGYSFVYKRLTKDDYQLQATPVVGGITGSRAFEADKSGAILVDGIPIEK